MFGVLVIDENKDFYNDNYFKIFDDMTEAQEYRDHVVNDMGLKATLYDYDIATKTYYSF